MKIVGCMDERTVRDHKWLWKPQGEIMPYAKLVCKEKLNVPVTPNSGWGLNVENGSSIKFSV